MKRIYAVALLSMTGGCAELGTIYHSRPIDSSNPHVLTVDAYQRSSFFVPRGGGDLRMCAEAAPDTFAAISASIAGEADVKTQSGQLAAGLSLSGATIERTQTINLLRESLYRTCERYLSNGISKATLVVQAARDQQTMVTVLAIEQLTRTIRPPSTVISAGGTSAAVPNTALIDLVVASRKDRQEAADAVGDSSIGYAIALEKGDCEKVTVAPADNDAKPPLDAWTACQRAKSVLATRQATLDKLDARLGQTLALGGGQGAASTGAATESGVVVPGGGGSVPSDEAVRDVAQAIVKIVTRPSINEVLMFCIGYLGKNPDYDKTGAAIEIPDAETKAMCANTVARRASDENTAAAELNSEYNGSPIQ